MSGIYAYGEQRACAVSDFNQDGRVDLAVGQNSDATKLYLNTTGNPGLRIKLNGSDNNPDAVGAMISTAETSREIQTGSGYWAHNSTTVIVPHPKGASKVQVTWPTGDRRAYTIPKNAKSVRLGIDGVVEVTR